MFISSREFIASDANILPGSFKKALDYINTTDFTELAPGRYEIDENNFVLVSEYETAPKEIKKFEAHEKYIDVQYVASGEEIIGAALRTGNEEVFQDKLKENDLIYFKEAFDSTDIVMKEGMYAVFYPNDLHCPGYI
jgi:YhcH/YjgK/YiaL family protein